jgi:hypothetical protein
VYRLVNAARVGHQLSGLVRSYLLSVPGDQSVLATGIVAGAFCVTTAVSGIWFGSPSIITARRP